MWAGAATLREERTRRKWSRRDVEAALREQGDKPISPSTLEKWESGKSEPLVSSGLKRLCRLYGVTLDDLFKEAR